MKKLLRPKDDVTSPINGSHRKDAPRPLSSSSSLSIPHQIEAKRININSTHCIRSVAFLDDKHIVSGGDEGIIRRWRIDDGTEVGTTMHAGNYICSVMASKDGAWVTGGTSGGKVMIWKASNCERFREFDWYRLTSVWAMDISTDGTRIATGSNDKTALVCGFPSGQRQLGPLQHGYDLAAVRLSPEGRFLATATWKYPSVRIFDSRDARLLIDFPVSVNSPYNQSLAWSSDEKQLFAFSQDGYVHCLDVFTGMMHSKWGPFEIGDDPGCIALARTGRFVAVAAKSVLTFWDTTTHQRIGFVIQHTHEIWTLAISSNFDIAAAGNKTITIRSLFDILPQPYRDSMLRSREGRRVTVDVAHHERIVRSLNDKIASLEGTIQQLSNSQNAVNQERDSFNESINTLLDELRERDKNSSLKIAYLSKAVQELNEQKDESNKTIASLRTDLHEREATAVTLEETVEDLQNQLAISKLAADEEKANLNQTIDSLRSELHARDSSAKSEVTRLEKTIQDLSVQLAESHSKVDSQMRLIHIHEQKQQCEALYAQGYIYDAARYLAHFASTVDESLESDEALAEWIADFRRRCSMALETVGDQALRSQKHPEALEAFSTALSLTSSPPTTLLAKWVRTALINGSVRDALDAVSKFKVAEFDVHRTICDILEGDGQVIQAIQCFQQLQVQSQGDASTLGERVRWEREFQQRCAEKLEIRGDIARESNNYDDAIKYYANALPLDPMNMNRIITKCCEVRAALWEEALVRADREIEADPTSYKGYSRKHAVLRRMGRHGEAFAAFTTMLTKLEQSPDPFVRRLRQRYINSTSTIRQIVQQTIRSVPRVVINTHTGHLCDKTDQTSAFEQSPVFDELRSSMTMGVDEASIRKEVKAFYRYVMLSHRWEDGEPLFQAVRGISVYTLEASSANSKLKTFCRLARSFGFQWVWSDTCCIDKKDNVVLQESLVAMFTWYRGSSLTIIYLRGVSSQSQQPGDLRSSVWNTRAWTYQEYVAAETVQFYTEDWKPYLGLTMYNHKHSPAIVSEMQQAAGDLRQELTVLQPDLGRVREKLYVASNRHTTVEEDTAYSLLGIFKAAIPVIYGEGNRAVGRLLDHVLTGSKDITILAWTGHSGDYNSCLPVDLTVYNELVPPHIPKPMGMVAMDRMVRSLRSSLPDLTVAVSMYRRLVTQVGAPSFAASRLQLSGIAFPVTQIFSETEPDPASDIRVYLMKTAMLGDVEVKTTDDLSGMKDTILIHPWISPSLYQDVSRGAAVDDTTRALRMLVRLRQTFGAFLLAPLWEGQDQYRRVASDCLIMVRIQEDTQLSDLTKAIRKLDIQ